MATSLKLVMDAMAIESVEKNGKLAIVAAAIVNLASFTPQLDLKKEKARFSAIHSFREDKHLSADITTMQRLIA